MIIMLFIIIMIKIAVGIKWKLRRNNRDKVEKRRKDRRGGGRRKRTRK